MELFKNDVKIYQIDKKHYAFKGISDSKLILDEILKEHKEKVEKQFERKIDLKTELKEENINGVLLRLYKYEEPQDKSIWTNFLPAVITKDLSFDLKITSFVLFAISNKRIFAIIGGRGYYVISKYINTTFGLDLYERISSPADDKLLFYSYRSLIGNVTSSKNILRETQSLSELLSVGKIFDEIHVKLNDTSFNTFFDIIDRKNDEKNSILNIGKSFHLKEEIDFVTYLKLVQQLDEILNLDSNSYITDFKKIDDELRIDDLNKSALVQVRDEMMNVFHYKTKTIKGDFDFTHPRQTQLFFECEYYRVFYKKKMIYETKERSEIFYGVLEFIYREHGTSLNQYDFNGVIFSINVKGYPNKGKNTEAPFLSHVCTELVNKNELRSYFLLDEKWYLLKGDYIKKLNLQCQDVIKENYWLNSPLDLVWGDSLSEGLYNESYSDKSNFIVFDKILFDNIELCDLLYYDDKNVYFIHVKRGFKNSLRDLSHQILISANKIAKELKSGEKFLLEISEQYEKVYGENLSDQLKIIFQKNVIHVMAFTFHKDILKDVEKSRSNIAKFSVIQCVNDLKQFQNEIRIVQIPT